MQMDSTANSAAPRDREKERRAGTGIGRVEEWTGIDIGTERTGRGRDKQGEEQ